MIIKYAINKYRNGDTCLHVSMVSVFSMHENQLESLWNTDSLGTTPDSGTAGLSMKLRICIFNNLPDISVQSFELP